MKTSLAFKVALELGAIIAGSDNQLHEVLKDYSKSLGIAYQIRDDLEDLLSETSYRLCRRPSILLAIAYEMRVKRKKYSRRPGVALLNVRPI